MPRIGNSTRLSATIKASPGIGRMGRDSTRVRIHRKAYPPRHHVNPLISGLQNAPLGVNMMANTAMLGFSIPMTPVTLVFGPTVTWAIALTGSLAGTAAAWYWVFSRHLVKSRAAAARPRS